MNANVRPHVICFQLGRVSSSEQMHLGGGVMPTEQPNLWGASDAYERYMGRWSRKVAPLFMSWVGPSGGRDWIDVGCGTGVMTSTVLAACQPSRIVAIDSSPAFLQAAQAKIVDPRVSFKQGDAQRLPEQDGDFDFAVSGLVLNFVPDKMAMVQEMLRVVRPGGTVGLYVWDYAGHMQLMRTFFDAAIALDPGAVAFDDGSMALMCRPKPLRDLFAESGLAEVEVTALDIPTAFDTFDDYWLPLLGGTGSAPRYCTALDEDARERLKEAIGRRLPTDPDGRILLAARAWAVKGRVAGEV